MEQSDELEFTFHDAIPRDRSLYLATDHLLQRVRTNGRFITEETVRELISDGNLSGNKPGEGGWHFWDLFSGVKMKLICDIGADLEPRMITGYSVVVDRQKAENSDRWGKHKLNQVELRTALSEGSIEISKSKLEKMECVKALDMEGHRIITALNWSTVQCLDCGLETRSKSELAGTSCSDT